MTDARFGSQWTEQVRVQTVNDDPSMTHQSFADECDVNWIISRYETQGVLTHVRREEGVYMDVSESGDFQTMQNNMKAISSAFYALPPEVQAEFDGPEDWITASEDADRIREIAKKHYRDMEAEDLAASEPPPAGAGGGSEEAGQGPDGAASE